MSDYQNAEFEDLEPDDDRSSTERFLPSRLNSSDSLMPSIHESEAGQLPAVRGSFWKSKERKLQELAREIAAGREALRERTGLYRDYADLTRAIVDLESARYEAQLKAARRIETEHLQAKLQRDEAEYQRLSNEIALAELKERRERQRSNAKRRAHLHEGQLQNDQAKQALEREELALRRRRVQKEREALDSPPAVSPDATALKSGHRPAATKAMPPELKTLIGLADSVAKIRRYCDKLIAEARVDHDLGRLATQEDLDNQIELIRDWYEEAVEASERRSNLEG